MRFNKKFVDWFWTIIFIASTIYIVAMWETQGAKSILWVVLIDTGLFLIMLWLNGGLKRLYEQAEFAGSVIRTQRELRKELKDLEEKDGVDGEDSENDLHK